MKINESWELIHALALAKTLSVYKKIYINEATLYDANVGVL